MLSSSSEEDGKKEKNYDALRLVTCFLVIERVCDDYVTRDRLIDKVTRSTRSFLNLNSINGV